jgi:PAS domain S-box-containing protein
MAKLRFFKRAARDATGERIGSVAHLAMVLAVIVLGTSAWVSYHNIRQLIDKERWVDHTHSALVQLQTILANATDAVTVERGYLLSDDRSFLPIIAARQSELAKQIDALKEFTADNPTQQVNVADLSSQMDSEFDVLDQAIAARQAAGSTTANFMPSGHVTRSKEIMDQVRGTISRMTSEENDLLQDRAKASKESFNKVLATLAVTTAIAMGLVVLSYLLIRRDAAQRRRAAAEHNRLANYNRLLIESTGDGIYGVDMEGHCTFLNNAGGRILGWKPEEALGKLMHELTHHHHPDGTVYSATECPIHQAFQTGRGCRIENELFWRADGSSFPVEYSASPIKNEGGIEGAVVAFSDITRRKQIEEDLKRAKDEAEAATEQAEAANVSKSQFLANMSHELRTPLNAVIMYSELLQEEAEDRKVEGFIPDLDKIRGAGRHLLALVNGVLDLSKIEAGKMELYLETFDVEPVVRDVAVTVQPLVQKRNNELVVLCDAATGAMHADVTKVRQILFNLLSNACKFTENGKVTLEVRREDGQGASDIVFRVTDSGIGITEEQIEKLFQPFTQADASTTRKFGGTGLGLVISKHFAEMMGGNLSVISESGKGSAFTLRLPAKVDTAALDKPKTPEPVIRSTTTGPSGLKVLIIDDDPNVRDLMARFLASEGIEAVTAADGEAGMLLARKMVPDLIFLDVMMPRMDGWTVLGSLKSDKKLSEIPVVMMTILNDQEMGYMLGASEYLNKPIDRSRLSAVLNKYRPKEGQCGVMIIEDDEPTRQVLARSVAKLGWTVVEAPNGRPALEYLKTTRPNLILLDLMMPQMDGFEFLAELRNKEEYQSIPVVVLTSKDLSPEERALLSGKVERILQKGTYSRDALLREVKQIVSHCADAARAVKLKDAAGEAVSAPEPSKQ